MDLDLVDRVCADFPESHVVGRTEDDRFGFTISHVSGLVTYNARGFLVDNQVGGIVLSLPRVVDTHSRACRRRCPESW